MSSELRKRPRLRRRVPRYSTPELWKRIQKEVREDDTLQRWFRGVRHRVIVVDRLNQLNQLASGLKRFQYNVATFVERSEEYILSSSLHSVGCHRGACKGVLGIQKIRYADPWQYQWFKVRKGKEYMFVHLANQAPQTSFIEVDRALFRGDQAHLLYTVEDQLPYGAKIIKITGNQAYSKEVDDMLTVALFLEVKQMEKEAYIQSCDKYRWMTRAGLSPSQKQHVKRNQLMPYFLSPDMMSKPALLLMGFECAYDCTGKQQRPHDEQCTLKTSETEPIYT